MHSHDGSKAGAGLPHSKLVLEIDGALVVQKSQVAEDVCLDASWLGFGIDLLQLRDDLLHRVFAVAALDDFEAGAVQSKRALGHEQRARLLIFFIQPAAGSETRRTGQFRSHGAVVSEQGVGAGNSASTNKGRPECQERAQQCCAPTKD